MLKWKALSTILIIAFILIGLIYNAASIRAGINSWRYDVRKADDATDYETLKEVEDTCRAMITSYESDKLMYEQYRDSDNPEKQSWSEQAKMRANKTVSIYNSYILKNSFVWTGNIPRDIQNELKVLD